MPNTAREFALPLGNALREPLAKLGPQSAELGASIRRQAVAIIVGMSRYDTASVKRRPLHRTRVLNAASELLDLLRAAHALGDFSDRDYQLTEAALDRFMSAMIADLCNEGDDKRGPALQNETPAGRSAASV